MNLFLLAFTYLSGCNDPQDSNNTTDTSDTDPIDTQETDSDTDTDTDSDIDTDSDADADTDTDSDADCDSYSGVRFSSTPDNTFVGERDDSDAFGDAVAAGDVDGDGFNELVVGAYGYEEEWYHQGAIYIYEDGVLESKLVGGVRWGLGGGLVASDLDGDGLPEILTGVGEIAGQGGTLIFKGGAALDGYDFSVDDYEGDPNITTILGANTLTLLGDINGDDVQDAVYGSGANCEIRSLDPDLLTAGGVMQWDDLPLVTEIRDDTYYSSGFCDDPAAGDVNGDGINDVIWSDGDSYSLGYGIVRLMYGQTDWPSAITVNGNTMTSGVDFLIFTGTQNGSGTGSSMSIRDVEGDGFSDVFLGATGHDNGTADSGAMYFFSGLHLVSDYNSGDNIILAPAGVETTMGEGKIVYGAPSASSLPHALISFSDDECPNLGGIAATTMAAYVFNGSTLADLPEESTVTTAADQALTVDGADAWFGDRGVSGDVTGDGVPDMILSDYGYNSNQGAVYVYEGTRE